MCHDAGRNDLGVIDLFYLPPQRAIEPLGESRSTIPTRHYRSPSFRKPYEAAASSVAAAYEQMRQRAAADVKTCRTLTPFERDRIRSH